MRCRVLFIAPLLVIAASVFAQDTNFAAPLAEIAAEVSVTSSAAPSAVKATGLLTDRLSVKELQRWSQIEGMVFARTTDGQYLHPTLINLWEWIDTSGHVVYVEFVKSSYGLTSTAGQFKIERLDPRGERHVGLIQLNLNNIDLAHVGQDTRRAAGFIPFEKLTREERYAEVLGHEMAHAADILTSLERTTKVEEVVENTNELLLHHLSLKRTEQITVDLQNRLHRRDELLETLESDADRLEAAVWRELAASKELREKLMANQSLL
jgi:hypothetical protein